MKKQETAVEWLIDWMKKNEYFIGNNLLQAFLQAKAMEREQMITSWHNGYDNQSPMIDEENCGKQYYNETYKAREQ